MRLNNRTIRRMYDGFSSVPGFWELDAWTCRATARSPYRRTAIELLQLESDSAVLDVACGTGLNFPEIQRHLRGRGSLVGLDLSPKTMALARRRVDREQWTNVELVTGSAADYRPNRPFDACLCTFAIEIIPPFREALDMMFQALRPGGRLALIGFQPSSHPFAAPFNPLFRAMGTLFGGVTAGRDVPALVRQRFQEIHFESCFGGFYYIQLAERRADAA
jgi:ubiquinone/menaquinone biosynthesis C-methylase UbiE